MLNKESVLFWNEVENVLYEENGHQFVVVFDLFNNHKYFYYRGLKEWKNEKGYLTDTCLSCQDKYKAWLDYFKIEY